MIEIDYTESCGNVYADLNRPDAEELLEKSKLAHRFMCVVRERRWHLLVVSAKLRMVPDTVQDILNGKLMYIDLEYLRDCVEDIEAI